MYDAHSHTVDGNKLTYGCGDKVQVEVEVHLDNDGHITCNWLEGKIVAIGEHLQEDGEPFFFVEFEEPYQIPGDYGRNPLTATHRVAQSRMRIWQQQ